MVPTGKFTVAPGENASPVPGSRAQVSTGESAPAATTAAQMRLLKPKRFDLPAPVLRIAKSLHISSSPFPNREATEADPRKFP
jgi:hypothetical protein